MADASIYFYETEIEWIGGKDLQISSGKLPVIAGGAPPEFKGREGVVGAGASVRRGAQ